MAPNIHINELAKYSLVFLYTAVFAILRLLVSAARLVREQGKSLKTGGGEGYVTASCADTQFLLFVATNLLFPKTPS